MMSNILRKITDAFRFAATNPSVTERGVAAAILRIVIYAA